VNGALVRYLAHGIARMRDIKRLAIFIAEPSMPLEHMLVSLFISPKAGFVALA
jgi:hypothetical protein